MATQLPTIFRSVCANAPRLWHGAAAVVAGAILAGCASTTDGGAIGLDRPQLLLLSSEKVNTMAAESFSKLSRTALSKRKLNTDARMTERVRRIGRDLIAQVDVFRADAPHWAWEIHVFDSNEINAFCAPGGKIGVYRGIIERLQLNDHELAAIMGHEIAHALREHTREKMSQKTLAGVVDTGISLGTGIPADWIHAGSSVVVHLPNSRAMELESDVMGLELMARAGYDPRQAANVWKKMRAVEKQGDRSAFLSTHPSGEERIALLEQHVPTTMPLYQAALQRKAAEASGQPVLLPMRPAP